MHPTIVTSNVLESASDLSTPRYMRAHTGGTGQRGRLVLVRTVHVPNHPDSVHEFGTHSALQWCPACEQYEHAAHRDCMRGHAECPDD
jgi:hypothetical protein